MTTRCAYIFFKNSYFFFFFLLRARLLSLPIATANCLVVVLSFALLFISLHKVAWSWKRLESKVCDRDTPCGVIVYRLVADACFFSLLFSRCTRSAGCCCCCWRVRDAQSQHLSLTESIICVFSRLWRCINRNWNKSNCRSFIDHSVLSQSQFPVENATMTLWWPGRVIHFLGRTSPSVAVNRAYLFAANYKQLNDCSTLNELCRTAHTSRWWIVGTTLHFTWNTFGVSRVLIYLSGDESLYDEWLPHPNATQNNNQTKMFANSFFVSFRFRVH